MIDVRTMASEELKNKLCEQCNKQFSDEPCEPPECRLLTVIENATPVVHGYWEKAHDDLGIERGWKCSCCKGSVYEMTYEPYQYCPHCGSKMDGFEV